MKIMTYNVRYSNEIDGIYSWDNRKKLLTDIIIEQDPDVLSLQEAKPDQLEYIDSALPGYQRVGEGRMRDGKPDEHCPIYFKNERFELAESRTIWFSETPHVPGSKSWGTTLPRIYTYAFLKDNNRGTQFGVINTHLEHKGHEARLKSIEILLNKAKSLAYMPIVITGDFNLQEDYPGYKAMTKDGSMRDARYISAKRPEGPSISTNGFGKFEQKTAIDYVFVNEGFNVKSHKTIENDPNDIYPSDHYPIVCEIEWTEI